MSDYSDSENPGRIVQNKPFDEALDVPDAEDVPSTYSPTPRNLAKINQLQTSSATNRNQNTLRPNPSASDKKQSKAMNESTASSGSNTPKLDDRPVQIQRREPMLEDEDRPYGKPRAPMVASDERDQDNETGPETDSEGNDSGDGSQQEQPNDIQGGYDPAAFRDLPVSQEIKDIFKFIERYQPQTIELEFKIKPFIPEYIPCIGDIDAFIKIPCPDTKHQNIGLTVIDEPSSKQTDPHVLDLQLRSMSKQSTATKQTVVKSVEGTNPKAIDSWIKNIRDLQKSKPVQVVNYAKEMPDIESLMQVWPPEFEDLLKEVNPPSPELQVDLPTYTDLVCALADIPVYKSKVQSLHLLFSLFSEFKNSEHFKQITEKGQNPSNPFASSKSKGADQLVIE